MISKIFGLASGLALCVSGAGWADDLKAVPKFDAASVGFDLNGAYTNVTVSISGPNDFHATGAAKTGSPTIDLRQMGKVEDGVYTYQLNATTDQKETSRSRLDNGREGGRQIVEMKGASASGSFHVRAGAIVKPAPRPPLTADPKSRQDGN